jgi:DNA-binding NarL/FixJ family response regulator
VRVAIAEDSVLLREGLARILEEADFEVVASCDNADDPLLKVHSFSPGHRDRRHPPAANPQ